MMYETSLQIIAKGSEFCKMLRDFKLHGLE